MDKVMVIAGPTASGKTDLAVELAIKINGEIISADSMQIYKGMNIGTAKPTLEERHGIPHHLIDIVNPDDEYSVAKFKEDALACINDIIKRGKMPIVAGGTGLYINSLVYNITFSETITDWEYRKALKKISEEQGPQILYKRLQEVDSKSAASIHPNNIKRIIRALEVYKTTGKPISEHKKASREVPPLYEFIVYGLQVERERLYQRIDKRVGIMMEKGLYEEVKSLLDCGYSPKLVSLQGIGYKEIIDAIEGKCALSEAIDRIKTNTRHFAKRQITWFNKTEGLMWIEYNHANTWAIIKLLVDVLNNER